MRILPSRVRVLVIGANGNLGSNVVAASLERGWSVYGTHHSEPPALPIESRSLDMRSLVGLDDLLAETDPDAVVNCAALTDVDGCERRPERAQAVNADAPRALAAACTEDGRAFVHISTDYVFDGQDRGRYSETDEPGPLQVYGETKLAGDRGVTEAHADALVVRPSFVWGIHRGRAELTGFPAWVRDRLQAGEPTPLFVDQHVTPSRAGCLASTLLSLLSAGASGLYNVASRDCVTPFAFGDTIRQRVGADKTLLTHASLEDVDRAAPRPPHTCLDVANVERELGRPQPTLEASLDAVTDRL